MRIWCVCPLLLVLRASIAMEQPTSSDLNNLVTHLIKTDNLPVQQNSYTKLTQQQCVMFTFSRDNCDKFAESLNRKDLVTAEETKRISLFVTKCLSRLNKDDRGLRQVWVFCNVLDEQVQMVTSLLLRGVGVHHAGLLPILKEIVEILYQQNYVKV